MTYGRGTRRRGFLWGFLGVLVLAAVILVGAGLSSPKRSPQRPAASVTGQADRGNRLYEDAMAALRSGDSTRGVELLRQAASLVPTDVRVRRALATAEASAKVSSTSAPDGDPAAPRPPSGNASSPATAPPPPRDSRALLPPALTEYVLGAVSQDGGELAVSLDPKPRSAVSGLVSHGVLAVHTFRDERASSHFVSSVIRASFPRSARDTSVGAIPAYFGTDGRRVAGLSFAWGRFAVDILLTAENGDPAGLFGAASKVAAEIPGL